MAFKYGDAVVLVQKSRVGDKDVIRRVNAIVVTSVTSTKDAPLRTPGRKELAEGEYLDLFYPRAFPLGQEPKARTAEAVFQFAGVVPPWQDGAFIGWEAGSVTAVAPTPAPPQPAEDEAPASGKKARWGNK